MKNIGIIILCRFNSKRLPGKILKEIDGKFILQHIIDKIKSVSDIQHIVVATSTEKTDDPIEAFCKKNNINIFRGSLNNVAERFLMAAKKFNFDYATRINGDNFFIDIYTLKEMLKIANENDFDFVSNVKNRTFPKGMSIEIVKTFFFEKQMKKFNKPDYFEHVTLYLYEHDKNQNFHYYYNTKLPEAAGIQMAIDTTDDFERTKYIYSKTGDNPTLKEIVQRYKEYYENKSF